MRRLLASLMLWALVGCATVAQPPRSALAPPAIPPTVVANAAALPYVAVANQAARISQRSGHVIQLLVDDPQGIAQRCRMCTDGPRIFASSSFLRTLSPNYQVAFLAHEFAHGDLGHPTVGRVLGAGLDVAASQIRVPTQYWLGASLAYSVGKMFTTNAVSRQTEREADLYAAQRLPLAGLTSQTFAQALRYLAMQEGNLGGGWFSTHPSYSNRIAAIEVLTNKNAAFAGFQVVQRSFNASVQGPPMRFCPVGGESYSENIRFCPNHGVELRSVGSTSSAVTFDTWKYQFLANLQAALAKQQEAASASKLHAGDAVFCPVGGERYGANVKVCPKHGVATLLTQGQQ